MLELIKERFKSTSTRLSLLVGVIVSFQFLHTLIKPYLDNSVISRFKRQEKNLKVVAKALDAEMDIDKWVLENYHLELYHSNKDDKGNFKFSYLKYKGCIYESWYSRTMGCWVYQDETQKRIRELSHE